MINLGSGKIKDLRLGSEKISKAYLGDKLVWTLGNIETENYIETRTRFITQPHESILYVNYFHWSRKIEEIKSIEIDGHSVRVSDIKDIEVYESGSILNCKIILNRPISRVLSLSEPLAKGVYVKIGF